MSSVRQALSNNRHQPASLRGIRHGGFRQCSVVFPMVSRSLRISVTGRTLAYSLPLRMSGPCRCRFHGTSSKIPKGVLLCHQNQFESVRTSPVLARSLSKRNIAARRARMRAAQKSRLPANASTRRVQPLSERFLQSAFKVMPTFMFRFLFRDSHLT